MSNFLKAFINYIEHLKAYTPFCGVYAFLFPILSLAQQPDSLLKARQLQEVIVTGQYGENSLKGSVYSVKIIDEKRIRQQGANNLKDVIANELNVRISNDPFLGSGISIQGMSGQNVKIMIDGVPVIGREGGTLDLTRLNLNNIERIEFVQGPMSVNFGTDALGGVINLITKKNRERQTSIGVNGYYESIGQYNSGFSGSVAGDKWNMQVNGARNFFSGYNTNDSSRYKIWKPRTQYFGDVMIGRRLRQGTLRFQTSFLDEKITDRDSGTITPDYAYGIDKYYYTRRFTGSVFYKHKLSERYSLDIIASYNYYRRIYNTVRKDLVTLKEDLVPSTDLQDTGYINNFMSRGTFLSVKSGGNISYQTGYEINYETNRGKSIADNIRSISDYNIFGSTEIKLGERILLRPAIRLIYNTQFTAPVVPSFNIKWDVRDFLTIRASYGRGFRAPSLTELYYSYFLNGHHIYGDPSLKPETQDNYQLSSGFEWKKKEHVFRIEPSLFYNYIINRISLVVLNSTLIEGRYTNINSFKNVGTNLTAEYRTPRYSFIAGYAYTGVNNTMQNQPVTNKFFYTDEARFNFNYTFTQSLLTCALFYKYNGRFQTYQQVNGITALGYINGYSLFDASISKQLFDKALSLTLGCKNIFNIVNIGANISGGIHSTQGNSTLAGMGRTVFCSLVYQLNLNKN